MHEALLASTIVVRRERRRRLGVQQLRALLRGLAQHGVDCGRADVGAGRRVVPHEQEARHDVVTVGHHPAAGGSVRGDRRVAACARRGAGSRRLRARGVATAIATGNAVSPLRFATLLLQSLPPHISWVCFTLYTMTWHCGHRMDALFVPRHLCKLQDRR